MGLAYLGVGLHAVVPQNLIRRIHDNLRAHMRALSEQMVLSQLMTLGSFCRCAILIRCSNSAPGVIRLAVMMYIRYPLSPRQVEDLLFERGIDIRHETVRVWWTRFRPMLAAEIRKRRIQQHRCHP